MILKHIKLFTETFRCSARKIWDKLLWGCDRLSADSFHRWEKRPKSTSLFVHKCPVSARLDPQQSDLLRFRSHKSSPPRTLSWPSQRSGQRGLTPCWAARNEYFFVRFAPNSFGVFQSTSNSLCSTREYRHAQQMFISPSAALLWMPSFSASLRVARGMCNFENPCVQTLQLNATCSIDPAAPIIGPMVCTCPNGQRPLVIFIYICV